MEVKLVVSYISYGVYVIIFFSICFFHLYIVIRCTLLRFNCRLPPISIRAPQIVNEMVPQDGWHSWKKQCYLVSDGYGYLLIVRVAAEITRDVPEIHYLDQTI